MVDSQRPANYSTIMNIPETELLGNEAASSPLPYHLIYKADNQLYALFLTSLSLVVTKIHENPIFSVPPTTKAMKYQATITAENAQRNHSLFLTIDRVDSSDIVIRTWKGCTLHKATKHPTTSQWY